MITLMPKGVTRSKWQRARPPIICGPPRISDELNPCTRGPLCFAAALQPLLEEVRAVFPDVLVAAIHHDAQIAGFNTKRHSIRN